MKKIHNLYELSERRRELRKHSTPQEKFLWSHLRNRQYGVKFRRQHSLGYYIADFYCPEKRLIVELDGIHHSSFEHREYDIHRDMILKGMDFSIIRIKNSEIDSDPERVLNKIRKAVTLSREERVG